MGTVRFWSSSGVVISGGSFRPVVATSLALIIILFPSLKGLYQQWDMAMIRTYLIIEIRKITTLTLGFSTLIILLTNWTCRDYSWLPGPSIRGEILLTSSAIYFTRNKTRWLSRLYKILPAILCFLFLYHLGDSLLTSDDHATFIYRLTLLGKYFPQIPFYYTGWNSGIDSRDYFATGTLGVFFIFSPLIYLFEVFQIYNIIIAILIFLIGPGAYYLAIRYVLHYPRLVALTTSFLSLTTNLITYRWILKYGTIGFYLSLILLPLVVSCFIKLKDSKDYISSKLWWLTLTSTTLLCLWPLTTLMILPLALVTLLLSRTLLKKRHFISLVVAGILINAPWMMLFWKVSNVNKFVQSPQNIEVAVKDGEQLFRHRAESPNLYTGLIRLRTEAISTNPLLVIATLLLTPLLRRSERKIWSIQIIWLLVMGTIMVPLKPQLELDRFYIGAIYLACLPLALCLRRMMYLSHCGSPATRIIAITTLGTATATALPVASIVQNRSIIQFSVRTQMTERLEQSINSLPRNGRILFSGCILHDVDGSHIAPLSLKTGQQLIASSPYHNIWYYTDAVPPQISRLGDLQVEKYLNKLNVHTVITNEKKWQRFLARSDRFERINQHDHFEYFRLKNFQSSYFLSGAGLIDETARNHIRLTPQTKDIILKYNWYPFLTSNNCEISPYDAGDNLNFIKLSDCKISQETIIKSVSPFKRLWQG
jgi:hypothetical protein